MKFFYFIIIFCLILISCNHSEGKVVKKEFTPAHYATQLHSHVIMSGKTFIHVADPPSQVWVKDEYTITILYGFSWDVFEITKEQYDRYNINDIVKTEIFK